MENEIVDVAPIQRAVNQNTYHEEAAKKIIRKYTVLSAGAALVPYDFVDVVSSTASQALMIKELCELYDVSYSKKLANVAFWSATGSIATKIISAAVGSIINISGGGVDLTGAAVAGIYTATVGEFYKIHLRDGGTLENANLADFSEFFIEEIKRGDLSMATFTNPGALMSHLNI